MANLTRMKILTTGATTQAPSNIKTGELAYSYVAGTQANNGDRLYIGTGTEVGGVAPNVDVIGGKYFTALLDHAHGTLTASSAIIVDANSHIDAMNIGSLRVDTSGGTGQTVTSIETSMAATPTNSQLITALAVKNYVDNEVTAQALDVAADGPTAGSVDLDSEVLTISGTANEIETSITDQTVTIGLPDDVTITGALTVNGNVTLGNEATDTVTTAGSLTVGGDLVVNGTTTSVNSNTVTVDDIIITLGGDTVPTVDDNLDRGIEFRWHDGTDAKLGFFGFDDSTGRLIYVPDATNTANVISGNLGDIDLGGAYIGNIQIGIAAGGEIDTGSGDLTLDSATGTVVVTDTLSAGTLSLTNDLAVTHGGTGVSSFTANAVFISNGDGTAISFLTGTEGSIVQFNSGGTPVVSNIIDGGTY